MAASSSIASTWGGSGAAPDMICEVESIMTCSVESKVYTSSGESASNGAAPLLVRQRRQLRGAYLQ
jgi:hypothetical protein